MPNRYEREHPDSGSAQGAVNYAINMGHIPKVCLRFEALNRAHHEIQRAIKGIDPPNAWAGGRNARCWRFLSAVREFPKPKLP